MTPVLDLDEAAAHAHAVPRSAFAPILATDHLQQAVSPRFSRSTSCFPPPPPSPGQDTRAVLVELGYAAEEIVELLRSGAVMSGLQLPSR